MIASVQYNDLVGTAAADVADWYFNSLQKYLVDSFASYDGERFSCRGCTAYFGGKNLVSVTFVCLDKETGKFVKFATKEWWTTDQFFELFKRFEIVIGKDINEVEIDEASERLLLTDNGADE